MNQNEKAKQFHALHQKGAPIILYNVWDAGSTRAVVESGAKAIATSSWAVAEAQGYKDGESIPLDLVEKITERIVASTDLPVTLDFEGGYAEDEKALSANIERILNLGIIGINFEDRVVKGKGLYAPERQAERIAAIRETASKRGIDLFINARTEVFFQKGTSQESADEAMQRAKLYFAAGASGLFVPGLNDQKLLKQIVLNTELAVNALAGDGAPSTEDMICCGIARISYGANPYADAIKRLSTEAKNALRYEATKEVCLS